MTALAFPLPFITALLAGILALRVLATAQGIPRARALFAAVFVVMALRALAVGLRFGYGVPGAAALQPILAMALPPLVWLGFRALAWPMPRLGLRQGLAHAAPVLLAAAFVALQPRRDLAWVVDLGVAASYLAYAAALLGRLADRGTAFGGLDLGAVADAQRQLVVMAGLMVFSAIVDLWIFASYRPEAGPPLTPIVGGHVFSVVLLGFLLVLAPQRLFGLLAARQAGRAAGGGETVGDAAASEQGAEGSAAARPPPADPEAAARRAADAALIEALREAMTGGLYRDPDLDAGRIARRLSVPQRRVSEAVNGALGLNLSQFVNGFRVEDACRRLTESDAPVTEIMLAVGFETKSNFNREFRRVTGTSPSQWRQRGRAHGA